MSIRVILALAALYALTVSVAEAQQRRPTTRVPMHVELSGGYGYQLGGGGSTREGRIDITSSGSYGFTLDGIRWELERYVAWPGQALSYKVGEQRILALREQAREELGDAFDLRAYHAFVLRTGAVPLDLLTERVEGWIARAKGSFRRR